MVKIIKMKNRCKNLGLKPFENILVILKFGSSSLSVL